MFLIASLVVVAQSATDDIERFAEFKNEAVGLKTEISSCRSLQLVNSAR